MPDSVKSEQVDGEGGSAESKQEIDRLFSAAYEELRRMAASVKNRGDGAAAVSPSTLVNEAWLKFAGAQPPEFKSSLHFKLTAARAMRQILVEAARRRDAHKRGGDGQVIFVTFEDFSEPVRCDKQILALNDSLDELSRLNPRQAKLVESRFFGGLDIAETAELLDVSEATVVREWRAAKAWLGGEIRRRA